MKKMSQARKCALKANEMKVVLKDEVSSDEEMEASLSPRWNFRSPKPLKKQLKDSNDSEEEKSESDYEEEESERYSEEQESERDSEDSEVEASKKKTKPTAAKNGKAAGLKKPSGTRATGQKRPQLSSEVGNTNKAKKGKKYDDDYDYSLSKEDKDRSEAMDLGAFVDEEGDDPNWVEPNYKDKEWFRTNCLKCQKCSKVFPTTAEANKCFNRHKGYLRCFVCFSVVSDKTNATKKLYKHYQLRHEDRDQTNIVKCPHCDKSVDFKIVSHHIIAKHFPEALDGGKSANNGNKTRQDPDVEEDEANEGNIPGSARSDVYKG